MERQYLLMYKDTNNKGGTYAWFDTEDEMKDFIEEYNVEVIEGLRIGSVEEII